MEHIAKSVAGTMYLGRSYRQCAYADADVWSFVQLEPTRYVHVAYGFEPNNTY